MISFRIPRDFSGVSRSILFVALTGTDSPSYAGAGVPCPWSRPRAACSWKRDEDWVVRKQSLIKLSFAVHAPGDSRIMVIWSPCQEEYFRIMRLPLPVILLFVVYVADHAKGYDAGRPEGGLGQSGHGSGCPDDLFLFSGRVYQKMRCSPPSAKFWKQFENEIENEIKNYQFFVKNLNLIKQDRLQIALTWNITLDSPCHSTTTPGFPSIASNPHKPNKTPSN